ncbi:ABC transporter permease [Methylocystis hirsuta]|uniref:ABC transporter permease n=1 Tax=Methylocystis hirsuta TaxID=369798 RepID=A0A3M9XRX3_9HYPH|nr:ABC transporter permease [Methylocystis hirsuta]RNJ50585.1 ABC transporter permease [Methylocystis hirsuta]
MGSVELNHVMDEIIPRGDLGTQALTPAGQSARGGDDAAAALELVSETAAAIREFEKQSAQAVARAHAAANALKEKLERAETRSERAEAALRQAEAEVEDLAAAIVQTHSDLEMLQSQTAAKEAELAASEQRMKDAECRAENADAAIQRIMDAIRTQLPV